MKTKLDERLRRALHHAGLNQKQLEDRAGLTRGYLSRVVNGERSRVEAGKLSRIAHACGVDFAWLSTGDGAMLPASVTTTATPPPPSATRDEPVTEGAVTVQRDTNNPFEVALADAFRRGKDFVLGDLDAVRGLLRNGASLLKDEANLVDAATSWLRAVSTLRRDGRPVTFETAMYRMATLGSERSARALDARTEALNAEARLELQKLGAEPPRQPVMPPRKRRDG